MWQRSSSDRLISAHRQSRESGVIWLVIFLCSTHKKPLLSFGYCLFCAANQKTMPNQAKNFQSQECQCLFTIKVSALLKHPFQERMNKKEEMFSPRVKYEPRARSKGKLKTPLFCKHSHLGR